MHYQNIWIVLNLVNAGITDRFTMGVGLIPLFLLEGAPTPFWISTKYAVPVVENRLILGVGALIGTTIGATGEHFGIAHGTTTFASRNANFSVGSGYGYSDGDRAKLPVISFSRMIRTSKRAYLVTEK